MKQISLLLILSNTYINCIYNNFLTDKAKAQYKKLNNVVDLTSIVVSNII